MKYAQDARDDGTANDHPTKGQAHHERQVDHAIVARQTLIADLQMVVLGLTVAAHRPLVPLCACAAVHRRVLVEEQRRAGLELFVPAGALIRLAGAEERPAAFQERLANSAAVEACGAHGGPVG